MQFFSLRAILPNQSALGHITHHGLVVDVTIKTLLFLLIVAPFACYGTNGYIPHGFGTAAKGMAGAGSVFPRDTLIAFSNSAGMVHLGEKLDVSVSFFMPDRSYTANADGVPTAGPTIPPGTVTSDNDLFLIPSLGINWQLDEQSTFGISIAGNGGLDTEYQATTWQNFVFPQNIGREEFIAQKPTGISLQQLAIGATYARQLTAQHAFGITPIFAIQSLYAEGLQPFRQLSESPANVTNNGHNYSFGGGVRVGWLGSVTDSLDLGVSYQTKLYMTKFDDYKGLLANQGEFDLPAILNVGLAYKYIPKLTFVFDYQRIFYGDIDALSNPNDRFTGPLGSDSGLGFGWDDVNVYKFGIQYDYNDTWSFRVGYSYGDEPFGNAQALFNVLAPATIQHHASFGFTYRIDQKNQIIFAYTHAPKNTIDGQNATFTGSQTGSVEMSQNDVEISWGRRF